MMKRVWKFLTFLIIGALLVTVISLANLGSRALAEEPKTWYVDDDRQDCPDADFTKIQDAVNAASPGDTIIVCPGTYTENVNVNKQLILKGVGGPVVNAGGNGSAITIGADECTIDGFKVTGSGTYIYDAGIIIYSNNNVIKDNIADSNGSLGISLYSSSNNTLRNNIMIGNKYNLGFPFSGFNKRTITTPFYYSSGHYRFTITRVYQYDEGAWDLSNYIHDIDTSNEVDGKPVYYLVNEKDKEISSNAGYVGVVNSTNIVVKDLTIKNNLEGILFVNTTNSKIENVNVSNNRYGILLNHSLNNILTHDNASLNCYGVYLYSSSNNTLVNNDTSSNRDFGIILVASPNNTLLDNTAKLNNIYGIICLYSSDNNTLKNNTASSNGSDGLCSFKSANNILIGNNASMNTFGVCLQDSINNTLIGNHITENKGSEPKSGILSLWPLTSNNILKNNNISNNEIGILEDRYTLKDDPPNIIYLNNFTDNKESVFLNFGISNNIWNSPDKITYTCNDNTYTNYLGNYWSDYTGSDANGDCVGDTPYIPTSYDDNYPLMKFFENYSQYGDVSGNGTISAYDASLILQYLVGLITLTPEQQEVADVSDNGTISAYDAALILQYTVGLITKFPIETIDAPSLNPKTENKLLAETIEQLEAVSLDKEQQQVLEQLKHLLTQRKPRPTHTSLLQNYPNPFNPETWIPYQLAEDADVSIAIYDVSGKLVRILRLGQKSSGFYMTKSTSACWDGRDELGQKVASGVYFYTLQAEDFRATRKMIILK